MREDPGGIAPSALRVVSPFQAFGHLKY